MRSYIAGAYDEHGKCVNLYEGPLDVIYELTKEGGYFDTHRVIFVPKKWGVHEMEGEKKVNKKILKLEDNDGDDCFVVIDKITKWVSVEQDLQFPNCRSAVISMKDKYPIYVKQTPQEITALIEEALKDAS